VEEIAKFNSEPAGGMDAFLEEFKKETDRAAAVLARAYLDDRLGALLREKFVGVPKFVEELFHGQGGLSSFSAKISITYAIGLISKQAADDFHIIREIGNRFAHKLHGLSFETPEIADRVGNLRIRKSLRQKDGKILSSDSIPVRGRFNIAVALLLLYAVEFRVSQMPKFQEPQVPSTIPVKVKDVKARARR
jgi:DNA-binding MltR family transcriptional regulator